MTPAAEAAAIEIREAVPEDGPALVATIAQVDTETDFLGEPGERISWADKAGQQLREFREKESAVYLLALDTGTIVGYLGAYRGGFAGNRGVLFIAHVGIREHLRGRRIGTRLFEAVEAWARARAVHRLELRVDEENARGLALYRRQGFVEEGRLVGSYRGRDGLRNHLWMGKLLDDSLPMAPMLDRKPPRLHRSLDAIGIRPIEPSDAAALQVFERRQLGALPSIYLKSVDEVHADVAAIEAELIATLQRPQIRVLVAVDPAGQMLAYAGLSPETYRRIAHEASCNVNVLPEWWGGGLGRRLMAEIDQWARQHRFSRMVAYVQANNERGRRFAAAAGFRPEAVLRRYAVIDGKAVDRIRLVRAP